MKNSFWVENYHKPPVDLILLKWNEIFLIVFCQTSWSLCSAVELVEQNCLISPNSGDNLLLFYLKILREDWERAEKWPGVTRASVDNGVNHINGWVPASPWSENRATIRTDNQINRDQASPHTGGRSKLSVLFVSALTCSERPVSSSRFFEELRCN